MSFNLSFRDSAGRFINHKLVFGSVLTRIGGVLAVVVLEKIAVSAFAYVVEKRQEKLKNEKIAA